MTSTPVRVASIGIGWWSNVLADAAGRSGALEIAACYTRSEDKREAFARQYGCKAASSYEEILADDSIDAIINTTPNHVHLETTRAAAEAGKHVFLDKPIATTVADGRAITQICRDAGVVLSVGYQRRRESHFRWVRERIAAGEFGDMVQAEANISRDREGKFEADSWRFQEEGMPGGVMLQIGIHYTDVLEMLLGPVKRVAGMSTQLALPGENPDVANVMLQHENEAISILSACYASASEYYMMNIYGREATAYYDLHNGLRHQKRHSDEISPVSCEKNDTIAEELSEFASCVRDGSAPEVGGEKATESLAVILAGVTSAREGRVVEVAELLEE
jgi:predicted dehydrogenase